MAKHGMYDESPSIKHDSEGKTRIEKPEKKKSKEHAEGKKEHESASSGLPTHVRHAAERRDMHNRHEMEHSVHDNGGNGEKKEMHARHIKEHKDMHTRHEKDAGMTNGSPDVGAPIEKIEKGAK